MKKNTIMRVAAFLLVAALLSTCAISGTFAKYTSSASSNDSARVAYWGWQPAKMDITGLFANAYTDKPVVAGEGETLTDNGTNITVKSDDDVIAPGTKNEATFGFKYVSNTTDSIAAPEVDYKFTVDATVTATAGQGVTKTLDDNPNFKWTLSGPGIDGTQTYGTVSALETALEGLSKDRVEAGSLPNNMTSSDNTYTIGWDWAFETVDNAETADKNEMAEQDAYDTAMGNAADLEDISISITITATQLD